MLFLFFGIVCWSQFLEVIVRQLFNGVKLLYESFYHSHNDIG